MFIDNDFMLTNDAARELYHTAAEHQPIIDYHCHLDQNKMDNRKCLSEHPFGTMKRALGQYYFLLKGKLKVTAEMSLFCLSYNLRRAISLKGVPELVASLR